MSNKLVEQDDGTVSIANGTSYVKAFPDLLALARARSEAAGKPVIVVVPRHRHRSGHPEVHIGPDTPLLPLRRDFERCQAGYLDENTVIGPDPSPILTPEEVTSDMTIEAAKQAKIAQEEAARQAKVNETKAMLEAARPMECDVMAWQCWWNFRQDDRFRRIMWLAVRWATRMQIEMDAGRSLTSEEGAISAADCGYEIEFEDNLQRDYDTVIAILRDCWPPAKQLWPDEA